MRLRLRDLVPDLPPVSAWEHARSAIGALVGILVTGLVSHAAVGDGAALPAMIAPMGASAVLLFAVPASPLAQPWSILGGNSVAALVGVSVAALVTDPFISAALAIGIAIALMMALRCLHPPSGAVALTAVLGGPSISALGYGFVLWPVAANSLILLATALLFNNLTGRSYPHVPRRAALDHGTRDPAPAARAGFTASDLDAALAEFDQLLDVGRDDLEAILREAEAHAMYRRSGEVTCGEIMSRDVVTIAPQASLGEALERLRRHHVKALPVIGPDARVLGIVTQTDLLDKARWDPRGPSIGWRQRLRARGRSRAPAGSVQAIMTTPVRTLRADMRIGEVARLMAEVGLHHMPVVGPDEMLLGIVSQTDLVSALLADRTAETRPGKTR